MTRQRTRPHARTRLSTTIRGGTGAMKVKKAGLNDHFSRAVTRASRKLGNSATRDLIQGMNGQRQALLDFILQRLQVVRGVQLRELHAINDREQWFRGLFWGHKGRSLPTPTRWGPVAKLYQRAAEAMARGHLGRGVQLLEQAIELEEATFESLPDYVQHRMQPNDPNRPERPAGGRPAEADGIAATAVCPSIQLDPAIQRAAVEIELVTSEAPVVGWRARRLHNWWGEEEEEEEASGDGETPKKKKKRRRRLEPTGA